MLLSFLIYCSCFLAFLPIIGEGSNSNNQEIQDSFDILKSHCPHLLSHVAELSHSNLDSLLRYVSADDEPTTNQPRKFTISLLASTHLTFKYRNES